jgi:hypothetical protein
VVYWAPDSLTWSATGLGHSALVEFLLSGQLATFYADLRWPGWEANSEAVAIDKGLSAYPFPWSAEGQDENVLRRPVPLDELVDVAEHAARELRGHPDGSPFEVKFT